MCCIMIGREQLKRARPGAAALPRARRYRPGLTLRFLPVATPRRWLRINHRKTTAAAAAADAGVVFYKYGATGINAVTINRNRPAPRADSAEYAGERGQNLYIINSVLCSARGNNFCGVRTPKADGSGRAKAHVYWAGRPRKRRLL
jgi:hypothetical protein